MTTLFRFSDIPNQDGRTALVTGANTGIGFEIARHLAKRGARVLMGCRNEGRAREAMRRIEREYGEANLAFVALDLADMDSIRAAADKVKEEDRLDILINNAGRIATKVEPAIGRAEMQFAVNHLGPFALTGLLLDKLSQDGGGRVIAQASIAHRSAQMDFDNLDGSKGYDPIAAYRRSKLANLLFMFELDRRLRFANSSVVSLASHPGIAVSELARDFGWANKLSRFVAGFFNSAEDGALPALQAATDPNAEGGEYFGPYGLREMRGKMSGPAIVARRARDPGTARHLWERSEELTGVSYDLPPP